MKFLVDSSAINCRMANETITEADLIQQFDDSAIEWNVVKKSLFPGFLVYTPQQRRIIPRLGAVNLCTVQLCECFDVEPGRRGDGNAVKRRQEEHASISVW